MYEVTGYSHWDPNEKKGSQVQILSSTFPMEKQIAVRFPWTINCCSLFHPGFDCFSRVYGLSVAWYYMDKNIKKNHINFFM